MIGTDRRYTSLLLNSSRKSKVVLLHEVFVETRPPQSLTSFIFQRKRWGTNALFNGFVNIFASSNIPWFMKVSACIDVLRIMSIYFRTFVWVSFWVYLTSIPLYLIWVLCATLFPLYVYTFVMILLCGDRKISLFYGFILNKMFSPFLMIAIWTQILFHFDDFSWGAGSARKEEVVDVVMLSGGHEKDCYINL